MFTTCLLDHDDIPAAAANRTYRYSLLSKCLVFYISASSGSSSLSDSLVKVVASKDLGLLDVCSGQGEPNQVEAPVCHSQESEVASRSLDSGSSGTKQVCTV